MKILMYTTSIRGRSYIARYALGEGGGQQFYRKTTADGGGVNKIIAYRMKKRHQIRSKFLKGKNESEREKKGRNHAFSCRFFCIAAKRKFTLLCMYLQSTIINQRKCVMTKLFALVLVQH